MTLERRKTTRKTYIVLTACPFCGQDFDVGEGNSGVKRREHFSQEGKCPNKWDFFESHPHGGTEA